MRDFQRSKVYAAERCMEQGHAAQKMTWREVNALVQRVLTDDAVQQRFNVGARGLSRIEVVFSSGQGARASRRNGSIQVRFGVWSRQPHVVLHEVAHHLAGLYNVHGEHFAFTCLWVTQRFMGIAAANELRHSYASHGVKVAANDTRSAEFSRELPEPVRGRMLPKVWLSTATPKPPHTVVTPFAFAAHTAPQGACHATGCTNKVDRRGLCRKHANESQS